ncbi:MAG: hypothetical protein RMK91_10410 [Pseudanabaenaceae cyanobacterium SKYGB_i_bin29]|nr:hypothetical protein [Pseudanabaenaceae cyanobacterium SKYG29]MDW8422264.1 hypothetical protein [Pseudanabaenaceae cyanobacterium SKYGB_i_bin29]
MDFLTLEEVQQIDQCALSGREKFLTRLAVMAWHLLEHISETRSQSIADLQVGDIIEWFITAQDLPWQGEDLDFPDTRQDEVSATNLPSYQKFLCRLVIQARLVLLTIAQELNTQPEALTLAQILSWIEQECAQRRARGEEPAFLAVQ